MKYSFESRATEREDMLIFGVDEQSQYLHTPPELAAHPMMSTSVIALRAGMADIGGELQAVADELTPTGFTRRAEKSVRDKIAPPFKAVQEAEPRARAHLAEPSSHV